MSGRRERTSPPGISAAVWIHLAVALLAASAVASVWPAFDRASAVTASLVIVVGGVSYVLTFTLAGRTNRWRGVASATIAIGAVVAGCFLLQYRHIAIEPKMAITDSFGRILSAPFPRFGHWAPFPNSLATLLEGLVPLAAGIAFGHGRRRARRVATACLVVMLVAVIVSASRGAWLALAASGVAWWFTRLTRTQRVRAALALAVVAALSVTWAASRMPPGEPWWFALGSLFDRPDRLDVYRHSLTLARDAPFTGIGSGDQFAMAMSRYALLIQVPFLTYSHNLVLDLWLEQGLLGLVAWVTLGAGLAVAAIAGERASLGIGFRGAWTGALAVFVHGCTDARQSVDGWTWFPLFVLAALVAARLKRFRTDLGPVAPWVPGITALAVAGVVVASAWPVTAAWWANLGAVQQARAELSKTLSPDDRAAALERARAHFERALTLDADQPTALRRLGLLDLSDERHAEAAGRLGVAWARDPASLTTRKAYGLALVWTGDLERAAALLASVPGIVGELNAWAAWRAGRGEVNLAIAVAQTSLRLAPEQPAVRARLAELLARKVPPA